MFNAINKAWDKFYSGEWDEVTLSDWLLGYEEQIVPSRRHFPLTCDKNINFRKI